MIECDSNNMTVKKLFQIADPEIVLYAYLMIEPPFDDYLEYDVQEKAEGIEEVKNYLNKAMNLILEADDSDEDKSKYTVFVMERTNTEIGKRYLKFTEAFLIDDEEAMNNCDKDFSIWNDAGECKIEHYAIDFDNPKTVATYRIAEESVRHMGIEACCAAILNEICFWRRRITSDDLECDSIEDLGKALDEAISDIEAERVYSFETVDELMDDLVGEYDWEWTVEDKMYRELYMEFKKKVKELEVSHAEKVEKEDYQRYIAAIRNEYQKRK